MLETLTRKNSQPRRRKRKPEMKASPLRLLSHLLNNVYLSPAAGVWTFSHPVCGVFLPVRSRWF